MTAAVPEPVAHRDAAGVLWVPVTAAEPGSLEIRNTSEDKVGNVTVWRDRHPWLRNIPWDDAELIVTAVNALLKPRAEVEARVQAAEQRAAEELRKLGCEALEATPGAQRVHIPVADLFDRAAALEEGQR